MRISDWSSDVCSSDLSRRQAEMPLADYLKGCRSDPMMYASATERLLAPIGEPTIIDTAKDQRLGRIFMNRTIRDDPNLDEFYSMEKTIDRIENYFSTASQGIKERKQIPYLFGPVERDN